MADGDEMSAGLISVVIPTYNHREYILETLESVFAQSYPHVEIIVVNDGSPDDTRELLRPLVEAGRIVYLEQENQGQGAARNRGLQAARGEYIAYLDDDDLLPPEKLAWQVEILRGEPQTVLAYGSYTRLHPDGTLAPGPQTPFPSGRVERAFLEGCWLLSPGQALIRASALREVGGFDPRIWGADDWDLYIRLARRGEFRYAGRTALIYRVHEQNASRQALKHVRNYYKVIRKHSGWNLPLMITQIRLAGGYFVPNLRQLAEEARESGEYRLAMAAYLHATLFSPRLLIRPKRTARLIGGALRRAFRF